MTRARWSAEADSPSCEPEEYAAQCRNVEEHKDEEMRLRVEREKRDKIGLETLIVKIFRLPGSYLDTSTERIIYLHCQNKNRNKHEQRFNRMMERACVALSRRDITLRDGRLLRVEYVAPP